MTLSWAVDAPGEWPRRRWAGRETAHLHWLHYGRPDPDPAPPTLGMVSDGERAGRRQAQARNNRHLGRGDPVTLKR